MAKEIPRLCRGFSIGSTDAQDRKTPCATIKLPVTAGDLKHKEDIYVNKPKQFSSYTLELQISYSVCAEV